jgi:CubicO group peptidase (beta-lactamase class C family)
MIRTSAIAFSAAGLFVLSAAQPLAADDSTERIRGLTLKQAAARIAKFPRDKQIVKALSVRRVGRVIRFDLDISENPDGLSWFIRLNLPTAAFEKTSRAFESAGYEISVSDSVVLEQQRYYSGVWVRQSGPPKPLVLPDLPVPVSGVVVDQFTRVDTLMTGFLQEHNVAGATVAISYKGKQLYSRGFGWADVTEQTPMPPDAVMRIASLSKPMTATAIMQLVEQKQLGLDDEVMPILKAARFRRPRDKRWRQITVRQLLQHTGGWDRDSSADPMFMTSQAREALRLKRQPKARDMVEWQLQQPLDFNPGSREAYSNVGYCVLGRIIESISGQTYEEYMTRQLLNPANMNDTRPGKSRLEERGMGEVHYHMQNQKRVAAVWSVFPDRRGRVRPQEVDGPYGAWDLEVMDAHAGWVSTAPDLVRFASAVLDDNSSLLNTETRSTMLERPIHVDDSKGHWYGCGWNAQRIGRNDFNLWHHGFLDGSASLLVRQWDGYTWAVLFNTGKSSSDERLALLIDQPLRRAIR